MHREGPQRLLIGAACGDRDELALGIAQGSQAAAEDAAGVDIDRVIQPLGPRHRRVAVDDRRLSVVLGHPVVAHGQAKLVGLARRLAVEGERAHLARAAPLHRFLESGMGDDELAIVEDVVAHQAVEEVGEVAAHDRPHLVRQRLELGQARLQPVRDLHVPPAQLAHQLHVVIARHAKRRPGVDHGAHQAHGVEDARPAVDQVPEEDGLASLGMRVDGRPATQAGNGGRRDVV